MTDPLVRIEVFNSKKGIVDYSEGDDEKEARISCDDWQSLSKLIKSVHACQLVAKPERDVTTLIKRLIEESKDTVFIVFDLHEEFKGLPTIDLITPDITKSCRLEIPKQPYSAVAMFKIWRSVIMNEKLPDNYVLVIAYATRFLEAGLEDLVAEAEKYCKIIIVAHRKLFDFCPAVRIIPYKNPMDDGRDI